MKTLILIFFASVLTNNIALTYFLGMCPFIAISKNTKAASGMGMAVTYVMVITAIVNYTIYTFVLIPMGLEYLAFLIFIIVIAGIVQVLEMLVERFFPVLYTSFGIFLPLITVNCAILGLSLFMILRDYSFLQMIFYSLGSGLGWWLAIAAMAGLRRMLMLSEPLASLGDAGITVILAGFMALSFFGFSGILPA
ncbi:MAG: NADH:ubiquinone reductase (Na(+)-transporting) subunit E [Spirochaetia bacterium]|nr:NADH:ubiquinone reductase (Na(+)-transporting) subunit E [Spirochaetia bacterium]